MQGYEVWFVVVSEMYHDKVDSSAIFKSQTWQFMHITYPIISENCDAKKPEECLLLTKHVAKIKQVNTTAPTDWQV